MNIFIDDVQSNDVSTMLVGGDAYLFINGVPAKTTIKKVRYFLSQEEKIEFARPAIQIDGMLSKNKKVIPDQYLQIENTLEFQCDYVHDIALRLHPIFNPPRSRWRNSSWKHNIFLNDIVADSVDPVRDITLIIKRILPSKASLAQITYDNPFVHLDGSIFDAYFLDETGQRYDLYSLVYASGKKWDDIVPVVK